MSLSKGQAIGTNAIQEDLNHSDINNVPQPTEANKSFAGLGGGKGVNQNLNFKGGAVITKGNLGPGGKGGTGP